MNKNNIIILVLCILLSECLLAQNDVKYIREGNNYYNNHKFQKSEISYRKALEKKSDSYKAAFNLGDALYKQEKYDDAANQFKSIVNNDLSKEDLAKAYHNLGNSLLKSKKYEESIDAFKSALRHNSKDEDTRYNLAYAQKMIKQQQQNKNQENKQNKNNQQKDQKNQENKQQQKDQKNQEKKNKQQQISKEDAERLLKASQENEKDTQKKLKEAKLINTEKMNIEKDW